MTVEVAAQELLVTQDCPIPGCANELPCSAHPGEKPTYQGRTVAAPRICRRCDVNPIKLPTTSRGPYSNLCATCIPLVGEEIAAKKKGMTVEEYRVSKRSAAAIPAAKPPPALPGPEMSAESVPIVGEAGPLLEKLLVTKDREALALRLGLVILDLIDYARSS